MPKCVIHFLCIIYVYIVYIYFRREGKRQRVNFFPLQGKCDKLLDSLTLDHPPLHRVVSLPFGPPVITSGRLSPSLWVSVSLLSQDSSQWLPGWLSSCCQSLVR
jgi:hypothetical protein